MTFQQRLRYLRNTLNLTQKEFADNCNVKLTVISKYENGVIYPNFEMLSKIGLAYTVNLNWLINDIGEVFINNHTKILTINENNLIELKDEEIKPDLAKDDKHNMQLENDLKVEYYSQDGTKTEIYTKDGQVEHISEDNIQLLQELLIKLQPCCNNTAKLKYLITAIKSLEDNGALSDLKMLIQGMETQRDIHSA